MPLLVLLQAHTPDHLDVAKKKEMQACVESKQEVDNLLKYR